MKARKLLTCSQLTSVLLALLNVTFSGCSKKMDSFRTRTNNTAVTAAFLDQEGFTYVTAEQIGLVADGVTNNTEKLQQFLDKNSNVEIRFSSGVYIVDQIVVKNKGTHLIGDTTTLKTNLTQITSQAIVLASETENVLFENFTVDGTSITSSFVAGVQLANVNNGAIRKVKVAGLRDSWGINSAFSYQILIDSCEVTGCANGIQIWGGFADKPTTQIGTANVTVSNCMVGDIKKLTEGGFNGAGIFASRGDKVTFVKNTVSDCSDVGLDLEGCTNSSIDNCTASNCVNGNISLFFGCSNINIVNNNSTSSGNGKFGVYFYAYNADLTRKNSNVVCDNNVISMYTTDGKAIQVDQKSSSNVTFSNNTVNVGPSSSFGMRSVFNDSLNLINNRFLLQGGSGTAISNEGGSSWDITGNYLSNSSVYTGQGASKGLFVLSFSPNSENPGPPAIKNMISNNEITGFDASILDYSGPSPDRPDNTYIGNKIENFYEDYVNQANADLIKANNTFIQNPNLIPKEELAGFRKIE